MPDSGQTRSPHPADGETRRAQFAPHTLSDAALAALGAGRPDAATLAQLRRAQFSRHLLLLRAIAAADPGAAAAYRELAAAERADPIRVRRILARPLVGLWAADCLTRLRAGSRATHAGVTHARVADTEATHAGATHPGVAHLGAAEAGAAGLRALAAQARHPIPAARARPDRPAVGGERDHEAPDGVPFRPDRPTATGAAPSDRVPRVTHDGLTLTVRLEDTDPARSLLGLTPATPLTGDDAAHWHDCLRHAWRLLVTRHRAAAEIVAEVLDCIVPVEPDPAARGISATSAHAYGAVAMSAPADPAALAVGLVHEVQHSILNAVRYLFELHTGPDAPGYSPWRDDPRPASGLLHGAYAYLAVTRFWRDEPGRLARFEFARWRSAVVDAADHLLASGGLTTAGTRFVTALRAEVTPWLAEPVPADVARLAAGANTDHRVRWRLRNLAVEPAAAAALADAWRRGLPPQAVTAATTLHPASGRALESSARLDLAHRWCRDASPTDAVSRTAHDPLPVAEDSTDPVPGADHHTGAARFPVPRADHPAPDPVPRADHPALDPDPRVDHHTGPVPDPLLDGGPGPTAGDLAYVRGDEAAARRAYAEAVQSDAGDDAAWSGLALVCGRTALRDRPEVVAAAFRALDEPATDPVMLATWLNS
ncbi:aKG-HExxH-type peptide beta-hydroxylase [Krasilnikovia sp. MM14-A1004]|uniref:aKG-HExxH-type peptide beta-hydroxylase n=1 Tax=Krasilnikovia sp. MM14-A1004 TaxID=3373541 RepID=UPI00399C9099